MHITNFKAIVLVIGFIFSMAAFTGGVSAINYEVNPGSGFQVISTVNSINYAIIETNTPLINNLAKKDTDYHFKKHKQGIENLKTISTSGIPPKGPGEIIMHNMPKMLSMMKTVKTKITNTFQTFYKKNLK